jgi:hypothetical protein
MVIPGICGSPAAVDFHVERELLEEMSTPGKDWTPGEYYEKRKLAKAKQQAYDAGLAKAFWEKSEAFTQA